MVGKPRNRVFAKSRQSQVAMDWCVQTCGPVACGDRALKAGINALLRPLKCG